MNPPKQLSTINKPTNPPNQPQLIFTYPHLYLLFKPNIASLLSQNLLFILSLPLETTFKSYSEMLTGFAPRRTELNTISLSKSVRSHF